MQTILIFLLAFIVSIAVAFLAGHAKGVQKERDKNQKEKLKKAESDRAFEIEKQTIKQEVFENAE